MAEEETEEQRIDGSATAPSDEDLDNLEEKLDFALPRPPDIVVGKCPTCPSMAPAWMATFADMATLLMAFFVLILSFVEMDEPSIFKEVSGSMSDAFGVQREVPSVEAPMANNIIASYFETSRVNPSLVTSVREETTDSDPLDEERKVTNNSGETTNNSDLDRLANALKSEIANGKVELASLNGKILVNVRADTEAQNESDSEQASSNGQIDQDTLEMYAKVAEAQSYLESSVEVQHLRGDTNQQQLLEKEEQITDRLQKVRANLKSQIERGLASVERIDDKVVIQLSSQDSFRSGSSDLQPRFLPTLASIAESLLETTGQLTVAGHTDNVPIAFSERFNSNWDLSAARASSVADYFLETAKIPNDRISVLGFADTKPIASNDTVDGRAQNRRIEITIDG